MEEARLTLKQKINNIYRKILPTINMLLMLTAGVVIGYFICVPSEELVSDNQSSTPTEVKEEENCNVQGINLHGTIMTYVPPHAEGDPNVDYDVIGSENVLFQIKNANKDPKIKAIVVEVDSYGGYPVAGEEIAIAVKNSIKPIVGLIRENGLSAAYWAVSGADKIWASKNSNVGSIGVTSSYLSNVEKNNKEGYKFEQLSIGKFKDTGNIDKPLTDEERALSLRDMKIIYDNFTETVSVNRDISIDNVKKFADGSSVLGDKAKELGLIDEIGGINEVEKYIQEKIGEKPEICWE